MSDSLPRFPRRRLLRYASLAGGGAVFLLARGGNPLEGSSQAVTGQGAAANVAFHVDLQQTLDVKLHPTAELRRQFERDGHLPANSSWALRTIGPPGRRSDRLTTQLRERIALFNLVVALEWVPDAAYLAGLHQAFDDAATLLFDVTDGYMTIGQVVIGGPVLMPVADVQIFATNRLWPRSSVSGLLVAEKYRAIRLGRGNWSKLRQYLYSWPESYRTLAHELGHYALGLKDQYLERLVRGAGDQRVGLVVPTLGLHIETLMASGAHSELSDREVIHRTSPHGAAVSEWTQLAAKFPDLQIDPNHVVEEAPPSLNPIPAFNVAPSGVGGGVAPKLTVSAGNDGHYWVYLLREQAGASSLLISQGMLPPTEVATDYALLGAQPGDSVLVIDAGGSGAPRIYRKELAQAPLGAVPAALHGWRDVTPAEWPLVAVAPVGEGYQHLSVQVEGSALQPTVQVFPLGAQGPATAADGVYEARVLDGLVLLRWGQGVDETLAICHYFQGGSPPSGFPSAPNPFPAGSGEGNAALFAYDDALSLPAKSSDPDYSKYNIVTTTNFAWNLDQRGRSYLFALATNHSLGGEVAGLDPTLALYFNDDHAALDLYRLTADGTPHWAPLGGVLFPERYYVAASMNERSAPGLFAAVPKPEFFRLLVPEA